MNEKHKNAARAVAVMDLTTLNETDTTDTIEQLVASIQPLLGTPAAVCVYSEFVDDAKVFLAQRELNHIKVATVTNFPAGDAALSDVINETLDKTNLKYIKVGYKVNFERSMTFGTELGGHIVSGHIQTTAKITDILYEQNNCQMSLRLDPQWMKYILHKGFVSINGCSLTIGETKENGFELHLIPETLNITNLGKIKIGDEVNIEVDQQTF